MGFTSFNPSYGLTLSDSDYAMLALALTVLLVGGAWATALIGVVMAFVVVAPDQFFLGTLHPIKSLAKLNPMRFPENVLVTDLSPNKQKPAAFPLLDGRYLGIIDEVWDHSIQDEVSAKAQHSRSDKGRFDIKSELCRQGMSENLCRSPVAYLMGGGSPGIQHDRLGFKLKVLRTFLINGPPNYDSQVSPQLAFSRSPAIPDLSQNCDNQEKVGYQNPRSGRIINELIDNPHTQAGISYSVGIFSGAIGIAFYLKISRFIGGCLIGLGLLPPILNWWIFLLLPSYVR
jgi:hypothetical protein